MMLDGVADGQVRYRIREYVAESTERHVFINADQYRQLVMQLVKTADGIKESRRLILEWCLSTAVEAAKLWPLSMLLIVLISAGRATGWFSVSALSDLTNNAHLLSQILRFGSVASLPLAVLMSWSLHRYKEDFCEMVDDLLNRCPQLLDSNLPNNKIHIITRE
jgi:hypothetical protein